MTPTSPKDWRDKIAIKNALVDALRYDLRGFATDIDSRTDIDRAVDFIIKFIESIEREAEGKRIASMRASVRKAREFLLEELRMEMFNIPGAWHEEIRGGTEMIEKKDVIDLIDTKIKGLTCKEN